jgi:hypothetical protein
MSRSARTIRVDVQELDGRSLLAAVPTTTMPTTTVPVAIAPQSATPSLVGSRRWSR